MIEQNHKKIGGKNIPFKSLSNFLLSYSIDSCFDFKSINNLVVLSNSFCNLNDDCIICSCPFFSD